MSNDTFWQTKLHARLHDPAEKALVLLRDPQGHEGGTSRVLHRDLGFHNLPVKDWLDPDNADVLEGVLFERGIPTTMYKQVKRADWWASAADRPQWPMQDDRVADWARVHWSKKPVLIHPLTGKQLNLTTLAETEIGDIKQRSTAHFRGLVVRDDDNAVAWQKTLLAFWRFGSELTEEEDSGKLGHLWTLLPADTRVPDHSIWDHLDLTSAFAGAFAGDANSEAALFALSIGPVQGFIAAARTTSDLWAGSHLLSRLAWEAMKVVCGQLGPDAILFPRLRGLPQVDLWLRDAMKLPSDWFKKCEWTKSNTDANPLFAAALPNRFVAVIPKAKAQYLAEQIEKAVRCWLQELGQTVVTRLLEAAGLPDDENIYCRRQMREQLDGFPEVHWSAIPFSLIRAKNTDRDTDLDVSSLAEAMFPFFGGNNAASDKPGFLSSDAWRVLQKDVHIDNLIFFAPNPGVLYPAIQELSERVLAAAKATRRFQQTEQQGWRCSLTGETEWLTTEPAQLEKSYRQQSNTLWAKVAESKPAWAKKGEHLGALPAIKRLWPTLFAEKVAEATGKKDGAATRFVVATHTMALAGNLERLHSVLTEPTGAAQKEAQVVTDIILKKTDQAQALPRKLAYLRDSHAARVLAALDRLRDSDDDKNELARLEAGIRKLLGHDPEAYYALLLLDGDRMGRILSGDEENCTISYRESFHPQVQDGFERLTGSNTVLKNYGAQKRAVSPNRHLAISAVLNDFALHVVPEVVEHEYRGRLLYAGGDDVMAMLPVVDLLPAMQRLRQVYSGDALEDQQTDWGKVRKSRELVCKDGFAWLKGRLMRMMGGGATASCGAVIAHYQAPLGAVMRELRAAEQRAKNEGGRDAFSLTVIKRSGGDLRLTTKWGRLDKGGKPVELLQKFCEFLAKPTVSRRAVYHSLVWLRDLPDKADAEMLGHLLCYQLARQTTGDKTVLVHHNVPDLARRLAELALQQTHCMKDTSARAWLGEFLSVAEFLAREVRWPAAETEA